MDSKTQLLALVDQTKELIGDYAELIPQNINHYSAAQIAQMVTILSQTAERQAQVLAGQADVVAAALSREALTQARHQRVGQEQQTRAEDQNQLAALQSELDQIVNF